MSDMQTIIDGISTAPVTIKGKTVELLQMDDYGRQLSNEIVMISLLSDQLEALQAIKALLEAKP
jgi:hypothetical protein